MRLAKAFFVLMLLSACSAITIEQTISPEGDAWIKATLVKADDSAFADLSGLCENFTSTTFFGTLKSPKCQETNATIVLTGWKNIENDGFKINSAVVESAYEFEPSATFLSGLVSNDSLLWGAVPLTSGPNAISNFQYSVEMPVAITKVRNGDISPTDPKEAQFSLEQTTDGRVYIEAKETNWKFFSSFVVFLLMVIGILIVWLSYFYLRGKT